MSTSYRARKTNTFDSVFNDTAPLWNDKETKKIPELTLFETLYETFVVSFTLSLPLEAMKYYPRQYVLLFGTASFFVLACVFGYFFSNSYMQQISQEFISLDPAAGDCV